ncbi:CHAD domain-containing protein [Aliiglaciecola sp. CAU 1673]|uniref:CHAD domain-containing protein n=1 Tax=Aliiglaciecola sp. CAU 1673 TaxID=3032595 RepID=UPI0023DA0527|nr:CHAD domain-containing protein [Aliiglaciecola sp. CAU 1673]MDF2177376.1 CHAD domain-containing protein [Aliiglaciecola sp. CAU 1673]
MGFCLQVDESLEEGLRRISLEQIRGAIKDIDSDKLSAHEKVHEVRKRCKRLRGLLRLVRPAMAEYSSANALFRDMARDLSSLRDNQACIESLGALIAACKSELKGQNLAPIRDYLHSQRDAQASEKKDVLEALKQVKKAMKKAVTEVDSWQLDTDKPQAWLAGFRANYRQGRRAMGLALQEPSTEHFHEWRKRVKYHWFHLQLLENIWPSLLIPLAEEAHQLSAIIGDEHDLSVLQSVLGPYHQRQNMDKTLALLFTLLDGRRAELRSQAFISGQRLYADTSKTLGKRFAAYWTQWRISKGE